MAPAGSKIPKNSRTSSSNPFVHHHEILLIYVSQVCIQSLTINAKLFLTNSVNTNYLHVLHPLVYPSLKLEKQRIEKGKIVKQIIEKD